MNMRCSPKQTESDSYLRLVVTLPMLHCSTPAYTDHEHGLLRHRRLRVGEELLASEVALLVRTGAGRSHDSKESEVVPRSTLNLWTRCCGNYT